MSDDIPSDFFDDFNKDEFIDGLSVIDSWNDNPDRKRVSNLSQVLDSVDDLRELIVGEKHSNKMEPNPSKKSKHLRSKSRDPLDDFIKPGSRRDPSKTYEAIKKDKEVKVKEILAKKLESSDDVRPPGTELDDFYSDNIRRRKHDNDSSRESKNRPTRESKNRPFSTDEDKERRDIDRERTRERHRERHFEDDLDQRRRHMSRIQRFSPRRSDHFSPQRSPLRIRRSPRRRAQRSRTPRRSPSRRSPYYNIPARYSPRRSRYSRSPDCPRRMHSPYNKTEDNFLYPEPDFGRNYITSSGYTGLESAFNGPPGSEYPTPAAGYPYAHTPAYTPGFPGQYDYSAAAPMPVPVPQPVPAPVLLHSEGSVTPVPINTPAVANSVMVPGVVQTPEPKSLPASTLPDSKKDFKTPFDALAQLVAEGKLSKEDYLKLAPNKGTGSGSGMDTKNRIAVLNRCQEALSKLEKFTLPNHLVMNNNIVGQDPKFLAPKFCSPLKRQAAVEFHFTKQYGSTVQQNKQLIDSITETIGLSKMVSSKKKVNKDMKDAAVQTTKPFCEICEIRETTRYYDVGTSVDQEHFSSSVYTQVVDHELVSSKAIFNPSGSKGDSGPISIAHLTPAQLVSQLAARAKTLKQTNDPSPVGSSYDRRQYEHQNQHSYHNYNNYRY